MSPPSDYMRTHLIEMMMLISFVIVYVEMGPSGTDVGPTITVRHRSHVITSHKTIKLNFTVVDFGTYM